MDGSVHGPHPKLYQLAEDGEGDAALVVKRIDDARGRPDREAVRTMLDVENTILDVAEKLDLIDFVQKRELERLKEDRNLPPPRRYAASVNCPAPPPSTAAAALIAQAARHQWRAASDDLGAVGQPVFSHSMPGTRSPKGS
ncbi:hypothetical protein [Streptomyces sp. NBC_00425]|uniref:hypothetical protein n=1 Tax=Streptomyces sp. NBC_00425 TaxID=2975740 RepID=UPI002E21023F